MRLLTVLLSAVLLTTTARAEQTLHSVSWAELRDSGRLTNGRVTPGDELELESSEQATLPIFELSAAAISAPVYALTGEVRCENLGGQGYLEMWSHFTEGEAYFSRTLGRGPLAPLAGTSNWRPFVVPFYNRPENRPPERISFGVHHPGGGKVLLRSVQLVQYAPGEDPLRTKGQWWSERQAGMVGGLAGSTVGLLGGLIGVLASAGKGRRVAFGGLRLMQGIGALSLVLGVLAVVRGQPYPVFYPLLLLGVIASVLPLTLAPTLRKRFEDAELRRMSALDAGA